MLVKMLVMLSEIILERKVIATLGVSLSEGSSSLSEKSSREICGARAPCYVKRLLRVEVGVKCMLTEQGFRLTK